MTHPFDEFDAEAMAAFKSTTTQISTRTFPILTTVVLAYGQPLEWRQGSDDRRVIVTGCGGLALTDLCQRGWVRFADGKLVEQYWRTLIGHKPLPRPANHADEEKWDFWPGTDRRRDPWQCKFRLPLKILNGDAADQIAVFVAANELTKGVLAPLCTDFLERRRRQKIVFTSAQAPGAKAFTPLLQVVGHTEDSDPLPGWHDAEESQPASADGGSKEPVVPYAGELDDSIPF